jgi:uncharacterized membrane protein YozB (DUF420 family)
LWKYRGTPIFTASQTELVPSAGKNVDMDRKPSGRAHTKVALTAAFLFFALLLYHVDAQLGMNHGFRYAGYFRFAFLFISLTFLAGTAVGLSQLRKR